MPDAQHGPQAVEKRLARTYEHPSYDDPYDAVRDYRRVQRAAANHPNKGSQALSTVVGLPRGRIRGWVDDDASAMPDAARAISVAQNNGWLDPTGAIALALAALAGHLLGGGAITERNYVPTVCAGRRVSLAAVDPVFQQLGVTTTRRHTEIDNRASEILPAEHASIVGRTMVAWGCPHGGRSEVTSLPDVLDQLGTAGKTAFLEAYILHRGVNYPRKATSRLQGDQLKAFHRAIAELIESVTGEQAQADKRGVTVPAAAMRELGLDE